jgi:hypothetical protein
MFELRNGRRWFKLRALRSGDGDLTVNIEPR